MIYSMSKMSGHSGSRMAWALVKDPAVADLMGHYIYVSTHGTTIEPQFRALITINQILADNGWF